MNAQRIRTAVAAVALGVAGAGAAYGGWVVLDAILNLSPLGKFVVAAGGVGMGVPAAILSIKGD